MTLVCGLVCKCKSLLVSEKGLSSTKQYTSSRPLLVSSVCIQQ